MTIFLRSIALTLVCACTSLAPVANALEHKPLRIKEFKLQTTVRTIEELLGESSGAQFFEFKNEPYDPAFTQAGGHPWGLTASGAFAMEPSQSRDGTVPSRDVKDIVVNTPAGLLGNPMAVPSCPLAQVTSVTSDELAEQCPAATQVGTYRIHLLGPTKEYFGPIVNVTPEAGQSGEFALENTAKSITTPLITARLVRTSAGYQLAVVSKEIPVINLRSFELTFWGVPADTSHDAMRGRICSKAEEEPLNCRGGGERAGVAPVPFLSMSTACSTGHQEVTMRADSWQEPGKAEINGEYSGYARKVFLFPGVTGCNLLKFEPLIEIQPDSLLADAPVGLGVDIKVPQPEQPGIDATPHLRDAVITLPDGMSISPGVVDGIAACDETGPEGINMTGPESEEIGLAGELRLAPGKCPDASIVGIAEAVTPLLGEPIKGHVYLARPGCGGAGQAACTEQDALDGNLYRMYLELGGTGQLAKAGVEIKVPGRVEANPVTGQLTVRFLENPQAPFSDLKVRLNGGPRAPLDNPATCGPAATVARFTPWSAPGTTPEGLFMPGTPDATPLSSFFVSGCSNPTPFHPGLVAGTMTPRAGRFSRFTVTLTRQDREQFIRGIQVHTPPGLLGVLASVPLCEEAAANAGTCPEGSRIGTVRVASGAGSHPFEIEGSVYLTGPYRGAPFGLSIVTHAVAGPFDLGLVVVRATIAVDRRDSTLTVTPDESGPYAIPQIIFGVPLRLQRISVNVDRPKFMFNPTSCTAEQVTAAVSGSENTVTSMARPFAVDGCKALSFKPTFTVATGGHTSRAKGASLDTKLSYPKGAMGVEANIAKVKVSLPKQLPSRLTTLQKACTVATFERNPAACPGASRVGIARARTPLLPVGLIGPVYFVSHGGQAFPSLIIVLQGDHVRVDLTGTTFISKAGITSSTFNAIPDVPVGSFELYLPQGKYSALAANGNLCKSRRKLKMPTEFVAQNGSVIKRQTQMTVTGCKGRTHR